MLRSFSYAKWSALKRLPDLDLNSAPVQKTIQSMVDGKKAIDPTVSIHEQLTQNRDGQVPPPEEMVRR